jgi:uncharacterized membrane protein
MEHQPPPLSAGSRDVLERLILFSDAVFAIAITLLAIDLRLPEHAGSYDDRGLIAALLDLGPAILAYVLSFFVIAMFWVGHLRTFRVIVRADSRFVGLNCVFLAFVAIVPFPTSVVAREGNLPSAAILYAAFGTGLATLSTLLWVYAARVGHLVSERVTPEVARHVTYLAAIVPLIFLLSIPIALVNPYVAEAVWLATAPAQMLLSRRFHLERAMAFESPAPSPSPRKTRH